MMQSKQEMLEVKKPAIYFVDKAFAARRRDCVLGVELFNFDLLHDLLASGYDVTLLADRSWSGDLEPLGRGDLSGRLHCLYAPGWCRGTPGLAMVWANVCVAERGGCDVLLQGNVADCLALGILTAKWMRVVRRTVLVAHLTPSRCAMMAQKILPGHIVSVNEAIDAVFRRAGFKERSVYYGIMRPERYYPRRERDDAAVVRIGLVGRLDDEWKGADTAMAAFRSLPEAVRSRAELHLASFVKKPAVPDADIVCHSWLSQQKMPEFLRTLDILIVPSRDGRVMRETFSQIAVQGMLTGLPIVVSDLQVLEEKVIEGGGLRAHSVAEFSIQLSNLIKSEALRRRLGAEAREIALRKYIWSTAKFLDLVKLA